MTLKSGIRYISKDLKKLHYSALVNYNGSVCLLSCILQSLTEALRHTGWKKASRDDTVTRFEYSAKKNPIVASLIESEGHGWIASVTGSSKVSHCYR